MKRVGILTFHFADNFGAVLQAYALERLINGLGEFSAKIIDYIPRGFQYEQRWCSAYEKNMFYKKRDCFNEFLQANCHLTEKCSNINNDMFDIYCIGSDQLWNTTNFDEAYFLKEVSREKKKISYATSIAISKDSPFLRKEVFENYVSSFDYISVREYESVRLIETLTKKKCVRMCDPTLLLDIEKYDEVIEDCAHNKEYILFFWLLNDDNVYSGIEYVNSIARKYDLPIIHSLYGEYERYLFNNEGCMFYSSPGQFLDYIKKAKYFVTNSYHAALFSLRYEKKPHIFLVDSMKSRFNTLIELYDIGGCVVHGQSVEDIESVKVDYEKIRRKMKSERDNGIRYLRHALGGDNDEK